MATLTATYPDALQTVLARALAQYGPAAVDDLVTNWLKERERAFDYDDFAAVREGRADPPTRARVRARLGL